MEGNCHFMFGAAIGASLAVNIDKISVFLPNIVSSPESATLLVFSSILGGIIPDIDSPQSYIGKMTVPVSKYIGKLGRKFGKTGCNHRGIFHDPTIYIIGLVLSYFYFSPIIGFFIGCLSHVFLDLFNPIGIPFMLTGRQLRLAKIQSGSKSSRVLTWICSSSAVIFGVLFRFELIKL